MKCFKARLKTQDLGQMTDVELKEEAGTTKLLMPV